MKTFAILLLAIIIPTHLSAYTGVIDDTIEMYQNEDGVKTIDISSSLFGLFSDGDETDNILEHIDNMRILTIDSDKFSKNTSDIYQDILDRITQENFKTIMSVNEKGEKIKFLLHKENGIVSDFIMLISNDKGLKCIHIKGEIDISKISGLSKSMNIPELKHIGKTGGEDDSSVNTTRTKTTTTTTIKSGNDATVEMKVKK